MSSRASSVPSPRRPVLTQVLISYEGREMRWLSALRSQYIKKLPNSQKVRLATRIGVRTLSRRPDSD